MSRDSQFLIMRNPPTSMRARARVVFPTRSNEIPEKVREDEDEGGGREEARRGPRGPFLRARV